MKKLHILFTAIVIFAAHTGHTQHNPCDHTISFLPQMHAVITDNGVEVAPEDLDAVAISQFRIAKYIKDHSGVPVFSEQAGETFSFKGIDSSKLQPKIDEFRKVFPTGLPESFELLSDDQKKLIALSGGEVVTLMLGYIDTVFGTTESNEIQDKVIGEARSAMEAAEGNQIEIGSAAYKKIFDVREQLALTEIKKFFSANSKSSEVILIYGFLHDFSRHNDVFPSHCVVKPNGF